MVCVKVLFDSENGQVFQNVQKYEESTGKVPGKYKESTGNIMGRYQASNGKSIESNGKILRM